MLGPYVEFLACSVSARRDGASFSVPRLCLTLRRVGFGDGSVFKLRGIEIWFVVNA